MCETKKTFYMTTPIYYPSNALHVGNAYTTVAADAMCRFKRLTGHDVYFLTGTDEHGQKVERRAKEAGVPPKEFVDKIVQGIKALWGQMDIDYTQFIRTTDEIHEKAVQKIFRKLYEQGDIYKGEYKGLYCTPCESYWTETQAKDNLCPDCGRPVELIGEEAYFLKLSKYQDWLIEYIEQNPDFIQPPSRANEMLKNFLRPGLEDLCVSRTSFKWGIPVDFDPKHVVYVWVDALTNYINALGYESEDDSLYQKFWPADIHLVGKEIVRFHTIIWPIMLKMLDLPLPRQIFGHGWLIFDGKKMSKSMGNVIDPVVLCNRYSSDAIRYFLLREIPFGADGQFSNESLLQRINSDLANDLGNLVSRTVAMIEKYFGGAVPAPGANTELETSLIARAEALPGRVDAALGALQYSNALAEIWAVIGESNRYIDLTTPWVLGKDPEQAGRLGTVLYTLAEVVRILSVLVGFAMPRTPGRIWAQLGIEEGALTTWESIQRFGRLPAGGTVKKGDALFPRLDIQQEMDALAALGGVPTKAAEPAKEEVKTDQPVAAQSASVESGVTGAASAEPISIDDFAKVQLRVAEVTACEPVPKSDKLLKLTLNVGDHTRTVVSGIAKYYAPEQMVGKRVVVIVNLKPAKLRGVVSEGMVLAASDDGDRLNLLAVDGDLGAGCVIS